MSKSEQTKRGIARAFVSLVESQPLEKVNVSKLVDAMGINRKTFYYHFTDKTDLVIWTFRSALADALQERFEREQLVEPGPGSQDPYQDLPCYVLNKLGVRSLDHSGFFRTFLNVLAGNRTYYLKVLSSPTAGLAPYLEGLYEPLVKADIEFILGGRYLPPESASFLSTYFVTAALGMLFRLLEHPELLSNQAAVEPFANLTHEALRHAIEDHPMRRAPRPAQ